ncbi:RNA polymerase II transcription factor SIII subunit A-domain-containing protein [Calycina marina]|uniref:RNA polymerase II transcription factor SIII subunit A-domain-containing protein n=1 Tax=Calycina marina TaxID=1763456 RepID=A0A9P8CGT6_9HELO|nr:RNA polymerase II transcription factor SIII subunit A-domain-containing protein [Calycina marina]
MSPPSLKSLTERACIKNISSIRDIGNLTYSQCVNVLKRIDSPRQLDIIEENSPAVAYDTIDLWKAFIARDIPEWRSKNYSPKSPNKWSRVYRKYQREQKAEIERSREELRMAMQGLKSEKAAMVSKIVDIKKLPKLPKDSRVVAKDGVLLKNTKGGGWVKQSSTLTWTAGSKTKMTDGKSVLNRARKEAREISAMSRMSRPTAMLRGNIGQITKAPVGLVEEYKRLARPTEQVGPVTIVVRKKTALTMDSSSAAARKEELARESRLLALTTKYKPTVGEHVISTSDEDSGDDLFDEPAARQFSGLKSKPQPRPISTSVSRLGLSDPSRPLPSKEKAGPTINSRSNLNRSQLKSQARPLTVSLAPTRPMTASLTSSKPSSQPASQQSSSPASALPPPPKQMTMKRKAPVDPFHRKKPRAS